MQKKRSAQAFIWWPLYPEFKSSPASSLSRDVIFKAKKVISIDTVGAGDTFTGYFLSEISKNKDIKTALLIATKAAAISVTRKGAIPSIPTIKEVEEFKD